MSVRTPESAPVIGFIGLGNMGRGMVRNLQAAGYALVVNDLLPEAGAEAVRSGAAWAATAAEAAAASDVVITMLPTPRHVSEAVHGATGILSGIRDGGTWIDMSTSVPEVAASVRDRFADRRLCIVDAPVSGMSVGAASGTLQIFIGGEADDVSRLRPVFEAMGDPERILHVGPSGAGYVVKLMINQLWFSHLMATTEVLSVGVKAGVDVEVLRRALAASPASSHMVERDILSILDHGDYDEGFALALASKDLGLSVDLARSLGMPFEVSGLVDQLYRRALATFGPRAGEMSPARLYEDLLDAPLRRTVGADA